MTRKTIKKKKANHKTAVRRDVVFKNRLKNYADDSKGAADAGDNIVRVQYLIIIRPISNYYTSSDITRFLLYFNIMMS